MRVIQPDRNRASAAGRAEIARLDSSAIPDNRIIELIAQANPDVRLVDLHVSVTGVRPVERALQCDALTVP